jgi:hypothetical protein
MRRVAAQAAHGRPPKTPVPSHSGHNSPTRTTLRPANMCGRGTSQTETRHPRALNAAATSAATPFGIVLLDALMRFPQLRRTRTMSAIAWRTCA